MKKRMITAMIGMACLVGLAGSQVTAFGAQAATSSRELLGGQTIFGDPSQTTELVGTGTEDIISADDGVVTLQEFCNDEELNAWFEESMDQVPVRMEYWIFGEAPYAMEFTDPDLIKAVIEALQTVTIGGPSDYDPGEWCDAGGDSFVFEMEDGSKWMFTFEMGTFHWDDSGYYNVDSYGTLMDVAGQLSEIGDPDDIYIYSEDDGFYTKCSEIYETQWEDEDSLIGGLNIMIYDDVEMSSALVTIARCLTDETDAEVYLSEEVPSLLEIMMSENDLHATGEEESEFQDGRSTYPGVHYTVANEEGMEWEVLIYVMETSDSLLDEDQLVRFVAVYEKPDSDEPEPDWKPGVINVYSSMEEQVQSVLYKAVHNFNLNYTDYEESEVQTGSGLFEFCNDDRLYAWLEKVESDPSAELIYTADSWHLISDQDAIQTVLDALKTVRIGDVSDAHVGGSDRQIFDFIDEEGNVAQTFMFFGNTFMWGAESYEVLDWGELEELDIESMAE